MGADHHRAAPFLQPHPRPPRGERWRRRLLPAAERPDRGEFHGRAQEAGRQQSARPAEQLWGRARAARRALGPGQRGAPGAAPRRTGPLGHGASRHDRARGAAVAGCARTRPGLRRQRVAAVRRCLHPGLLAAAGRGGGAGGRPARGLHPQQRALQRLRGGHLGPRELGPRLHVPLDARADSGHGDPVPVVARGSGWARRVGQAAGPLVPEGHPPEPGLGVPVGPREAVGGGAGERLRPRRAHAQAGRGHARGPFPADERAPAADDPEGAHKVHEQAPG
mmetsp:Transcript_99147/g.280817  ORF Transcript_99147/g.280817 Transcript_99147/m.280817 type:complete len:279 (+) Transcript_99147:243-1079(+)